MTEVRFGDSNDMPDYKAPPRFWRARGVELLRMFCLSMMHFASARLLHWPLHNRKP